jgi:ELWxxDGT repeat protein
MLAHFNISRMIKKLPFVHSFAFALDSLFLVSVCFTVFLISSQSFAQSVFIQDLNERENTDEFEFASLVDGNGKTFVVVRGRELWTSYLAADDQDVIVKLGAYDSVANLTVVGDKLYFTALTVDKGMELYRSDGSPEGTQLVKDIYPGTGNGNPAFLVNVNGTLYFSATNGTSGKELWKSNGTATTTVQVKDIFPKAGSSNPSHLTNVNSVLFFSANDGIHGYELWKSNGSTEGTMLVKDIRPESKVSSLPDQLKNVAGTLYFSANEPATGRELYKSDGTATGTLLVKDIRTGVGSSTIGNVTANGNILIFTANDGLTGAELWKSDGSAAGTVLVKDMTPGPAGSHGEQSGQFKMGNFTSINGQVYYTAYDRNTYMIWKTDGTTAGTVAIRPAYGAVNEQPRPRFVSMNGYIFCFNSDWPETWSIPLMRMNPDGSDPRWIFEVYIGYQSNVYSPELVVVQDKNGVNHLHYYGIVAFEGFKLLKSGGTENYDDTYILPDPYIPTDSSNPHDFKRFKNKTYFIANPTWYDNQSLWAADGSSVQEVVWFSYNGGEFAFTDNNVYTSGQDWLELYRTNGDTYSQVYLADDYGALPAVNLTGVKSKMYFTNENDELYVVDDASTQVTFLKGFFNNIYDFSPVGSYLVFRSRNSSNGEELWRSNGTSSGTIRYTTISPTFQTPSAYRPTATIRTNTHYFIANDGVHGNEIWRTQGTGSSTYMVTDLNPNDHLFIQEGKENDIRSLYEFRDSLYISAVDNTGNWALYKTNGTAAGMRKVLNINQIVEMVEAQGKLYLFVLDPDEAGKLNIYVTNGTAQTTMFLFQIPTLQYSHAEVLNSLYVRPATGNSDVWRTDGTTCGTFSFDLGVEAGNEIGEYGAGLIFPGLHQDKGVEPYYFDTTPFQVPCDEETFVASESSAQLIGGGEEFASAHPNPFRDELVLRIAGENHAEAQVQVYTVSGIRVDDLGMLKCNTDYSIGSAWPLGMYVLKINAAGRISSQKVIKR